MRSVFVAFLAGLVTACNLFRPPDSTPPRDSGSPSDTPAATDASDDASSDGGMLTDTRKDTTDGGPADSGPSDTGATDTPVIPSDSDADGIPDANDNCPDTPNDAQSDSDADGIGDACDATYDCDAICDVTCNTGEEPECDVDCAGSDLCTWSSNGGGTIACRGRSNCVADCPGGGCTMTCSGQATCSFTCDGGMCDFTCAAMNACSTSCDGGNCTGP